MRNFGKFGERGLAEAGQWEGVSRGIGERGLREEIWEEGRPEGGRSEEEEGRGVQWWAVWGEGGPSEDSTAGKQKTWGALEEDGPGEPFAGSIVQ